MDRLQLLLTKLAEESAEITQVALKAQQFGLTEEYQDTTNVERIHRELDDLMAVVLMLNDEYDFGYDPNQGWIDIKKHKINHYARHSRDLGLVDDWERK